MTLPYTALRAAAPRAGVPRLDPDYTTTVDKWWGGHPFNPDSPQHRAEIPSPEPVRDIASGGDLQLAVDALPAEGGTLRLAPGGTYAGFEIVARSNVHVVCEAGQAIIRGHVRVASSKEAMDYGTYDLAISRGRRDARVWELYKRPTRNFYFKNLVFDAQSQRVGLVGLQRVYDVVLDGCVFKNGVNPKKGHPGQFWAHEGVNNIWCRSCRFEGECGYAAYLDGAHGSGMIGCTVELSRFNSGGFLFLTNDDFTEDVNENGRIDREEERSAKYIVISGCTFNGSKDTAVQFTGENILVTSNKAPGALRVFAGLDPRWNSTHRGVTYRFYDLMVVANEVGVVREALVLMRNAAAVSVPLDCEVPRMGRCTVRGNVVESCPALVKTATVGLPPWRDKAASSDVATFDGPDVIENNTVKLRPMR